MKKIWSTPQLVLLVRAKPEESVLTSCKTAASPTGLATVSDNIPSDLFGGCYRAPDFGGVTAPVQCSACNALTTS